MYRIATLLDATSDLQLGRIDGNEWLRTMAKIAGASDACTVIWVPGKPAQITLFQSGDWNCFTPALRQALDDRRGDLGAPQPELLEHIPAFNKLPREAQSIVSDPRNMVAFLDSEPAMAFTALRRLPNQPAWQPQDRAKFSEIVPALYKAHTVHKKIRQTDYQLRIGNAAINSLPMCIVAMSADARVIKANKQALRFFNRNTPFRIENNHLEILDEHVQGEFMNQLARIRELPIEKLPEFIWNRSFSNSWDSSTYQVCIQAFRDPDWSLISTPHDRYIILTIQAPDISVKATPEQLKEFYDLTTAQARLVAAIMDGRSVNEAAEYLNVSVNTARTHLRSIYNRLGVSGQTELVGLIGQTIVKYIPDPNNRP